MDTAPDIQGLAHTRLVPPQIGIFTNMFQTLHMQPRVTIWNDEAVFILEMVKTSETLSKRFCRYLLSIGFRLSDELYFITNACELLPFQDYLQVQTLTWDFFRKTSDDCVRTEIWIHILELIWQTEILKQWLLKMTQAIFPHSIGRYEVLIELRSVLDYEKVATLTLMAANYQKGHLDEIGKLFYLRNVVESYLGNNYYLKNRYMVFVTGGETLIPPQPALMLPGAKRLPLNATSPQAGQMFISHQSAAMPTLVSGYYATPESGKYTASESSGLKGFTSSGSEQTRPKYSNTKSEGSSKRKRKAS